MPPLEYDQLRALAIKNHKRVEEAAFIAEAERQARVTSMASAARPAAALGRPAESARTR